MARIASQEIGGYYKTPVHLIPHIARLINTEQAHKQEKNGLCGKYSFVDPCAGTGEALELLVKETFGTDALKSYRPYYPTVATYACELEQERANKLRNRLGWNSNYLHGDAFHVDWGGEGRGAVLYLNPPYDTDKTYGRLEQRFLDRFTNLLAPGFGILLFVVPRYALAASATHLATHYHNIRCFAFPEPEYHIFKQVVLVAQRRETPAVFVDSGLVDTINKWADKAKLPTLYETTELYTLPANTYTDLPTWRLTPVDVEGMYKGCKVWQYGRNTLKRTYNMGIDRKLDDLIGRVFPVVMPLRPAHIAISLASGLLNGQEVQPDNPASGLPAIMVKGVFEREYKTVDEKEDKDGNLLYVTQVQQPKLKVTVLEMGNWTYYELKQGSEPTDTTDFDKMNVADLLTHYGRNLAVLMRQQCPPLHDPSDPAHDITLPTFGIKPFTAQHHATIAALKMIFGTHPYAGERPFVQGEVGTGKTGVAAMVAECLSRDHFHATRQKLAAIGVAGGKVKPVDRVLVMCPPHLLDGWRDQIKQFLPHAKVEILDDVTNVERVVNTPPDTLTFCLLSREMGKLGHAWIAATKNGRCPACGAEVDKTDKEIIGKHLYCQHQTLIPQNNKARLAVRLAELAAPALWNGNIDNLVRAPHLRPKEGDERELFRKATWLRRVAREDKFEETAIGRFLLPLATKAEKQCRKGDYDVQDTIAWIKRLFLVVEHPGRDAALRDVCLQLFNATLGNKSYVLHTPQQNARTNIRRLALITADPTKRQELLAELAVQHSMDSNWVLAHITEDPAPASPKHIADLIEKLVNEGQFAKGAPCNTPLFQATPQPRRVPLATYISRYHKDKFQLVVVDEAHEYAHDGTAQERAAHRMTELSCPTLALTGTSNNGYSSSLFSNMWALSRQFRTQFGRNQVGEFVTRYGYRKIRVEPDEGKFLPGNFGAMSDRVDTGTSLKMRVMGEAPGVMPLFIIKHLLPLSVSIHKSDLDAELPPVREIPETVQAADELHDAYMELRETLIQQIMDDFRNDPDRAGKLWGQVALLPSYLDRCHSDTGNYGDPGNRSYDIRYADGVLVTSAKTFGHEYITAKEQWLIETIERELDEKRPCMVFLMNTRSGLAHRMVRILSEQTGKRVVYLDSEKVSAGKRQAWIDAQVTGKKTAVLVVNPKAVETGLNNLVYFPTAVWYQNPMCNPVLYSQANGRIHRPGQKADEVRVYVPYYQDTSQTNQFNLLVNKIAASRQTDGLDITTALAAVGAVETDAIDTMAIGKALYKMLISEVRVRPSLPLLPPQPIKPMVKHEKRPLVVATPKFEDVPARGAQLRLFEGRPSYQWGD